MAPTACCAGRSSAGSCAGESLAIGFRALAISANYAAQEEARKVRALDESARSRDLRVPVAIGFAVMLFKVTPGLLTELLPIKGTGWFVIVERV